MASQKRKPARKTGKSQVRKTTSKSKKTSRAVNNRNEVGTPKAIVNDIKFIVLFTITVFLTVANFGLGGAAGMISSRFLFGLFGIFAYIVPICIFIAIVFFVANISSSKAMKKLVAVLLLFLMMCTLMQLIYCGTASGLIKGNYYKICGVNKSGGGYIGYIIAALFCSGIGIYGAYIVTVAIMLVTIVFISEKALVASITNGSKKAYKSAKDDFSRMKDNSARRIAHKEKVRMERAGNQVRGVAIPKIHDKDYQDPDIHELVDNGTLFMGHVDIDENDEKLTLDLETAELKNSEEVVYDNSSVMQENEYIPREVFEPSSNASHENNDGEFVPAERIEVSKSAKEVMNRKAFSGVATHVNKPAVVSNERIVPMVEENNNSDGKQPNENAKMQTTKKVSSNYVMPPISLLRKGQTRRKTEGRVVGLSATAKKLQDTLNAFGVKAHVVDESRGPSVTRYELQPETGTKVSRITSLSDDIKLNLAASDIRIEAPIPGKAAVGIEVPNDTRESVFLRELIESEELSKNPSKLAFAAGKDIAGKVIVADIAKMPHMLIAGTTGSGKSVFTNSIIMSILYRAKPSEVKLIIVDPKVVEFGVYNGIPHLLSPVVTDPKKAAGALNWAVAEMGERYQLFAKYNVRDLKGYNEKIKSMNYKDGEEVLEIKPQIVIIIDELADLMMVASKEVEGAICRLAQLARAAGIHLIIATQRPSVDVVTGLIKANIPSRVALLVSSGTDSRTIIDCNGGEKLLGNGDMLFYPSGYVKPVRLQGAFVSDSEVQAVVSFLVNNNQDVQYDEKLSNVEYTSNIIDNNGASNEDSRDPLYEQAARFIIEKDKGSTSMLQRMFKIGFNRASRIIDQLESAGVVGADEGTKPRKVLMTIDEFEKII